jgi:uncharacterized OB-fold protein
MGSKKPVDDRFKKFGTVSFTAISKTNDFIDFLEDGKVAGTKCNGCGLAFFPPRADCYQCLGSDMQWFVVTGAGKLITYSKLQFAPVGFDQDLPYCIALVDYGRFKVFGRIAAELPEEELQLGMEMTAAANRLPNGQLNYVFKKI